MNNVTKISDHIKSIPYRPGTRIYYTGDMANCGGYGTITNVNQPTKYSPLSVDITFDEERFEGDDKKTRGIYIIMFEKSIGQRFYLAADWDAMRAERIAEMAARMKGRVS